MCVNSLYDQGLVLEDKRFVQYGRDCVVFGPGLEHQTLISWYFVLLQLLHSPLPYSRREEKDKERDKDDKIKMQTVVVNHLHRE